MFSFSDDRNIVTIKKYLKRDAYVPIRQLANEVLGKDDDNMCDMIYNVCKDNSIIKKKIAIDEDNGIHLFYYMAQPNDEPSLSVYSLYDGRYMDEVIRDYIETIDDSDTIDVFSKFSNGTSYIRTALHNGVNYIIDKALDDPDKLIKIPIDEQEKHPSVFIKAYRRIIDDKDKEIEDLKEKNRNRDALATISLSIFLAIIGAHITYIFYYASV